MAVYCDDLVLAGTQYRPAGFGQNATPGWADDLVYVASFAGGADVDVDCGVGAIALQGLAATVDTSTVVSCGVGSVDLTGLAATVFNGTLVSCSVGEVALTGLFATVTANENTNVNCGIGIVSMVGLTCTVGSRPQPGRITISEGSPP